MADAFALNQGLSRTETSFATLADAFALNQGLSRTETSSATLGDAFALIQVLSRSETSSIMLGDAFALNQVLSRTETSSATLKESVVFTVQRNSVSLTLTPSAPTEDGEDSPDPPILLAEYILTQGASAGNMLVGIGR